MHGSFQGNPGRHTHLRRGACWPSPMPASLHACSALSMCRWVGSRPAPTIPASLLPRHANCPASAAWAPPLVGFNLTQPLLQAGAGAAAA